MAIDCSSTFVGGFLCSTQVQVAWISIDAPQHKRGLCYPRHLLLVVSSIWVPNLRGGLPLAVGFSPQVQLSSTLTS